jgi:hypothetical protein
MLREGGASGNRRADRLRTAVRQQVVTDYRIIRLCG